MCIGWIDVYVTVLCGDDLDSASAGRRPGHDAAAAHESQGTAY